MLKDITLGRYYPAASVLHSLDPRTKICFLIVYVVSVFFAKSLVTCFFTAFVLAVLLLISMVPLKYMFRGLKAIALIVLAVCIINIFAVENGFAKVTLVTLRMVEIVLVSNLLTLTTKPKDVADGVEKLLYPLKKLGLPVHDMATTMAIAIRFIPILAEESDRIIQAQKARGADFECKNPVKRVMVLATVLVPLFDLAFKRADELAEAMDSRLYGCRDAGHLYELSIGEKDIFSFILIAEYVAVFVLWRVLCL